MCGRFALWLENEKICSKCTYKPQNKHNIDKNVYETPQWLDVFDNLAYKPSYNICPDRLCPVLTLNKHFKHKKIENVMNTERVIVPMKWGLVPNWAKKDASSQFRTINSRSETIHTKPAFRHSISSGYRCVVLAQGFFEWKNRKPVFVYSEENSGDIDDNFENLIYLAGIFDEWTDPTTNQLVYSFSILTTNSNGTKLESIHDRMPVILDSYEITNWLHADKLNIKDAQKYMFAPNDCIKLHSVSMSVNFVGNDSIENIQNLDLKGFHKKDENKQEKQIKETHKKIHKSISQYFNKTKKLRGS